MVDTSADKYKAINLVVIGDPSVGKTSIIKSYMKCPEENVPTVIDCYQKEVTIDY